MPKAKSQPNISPSLVERLSDGTSVTSDSNNIMNDGVSVMSYEIGVMIETGNPLGGYGSSSLIHLVIRQGLLSVALILGRVRYPKRLQELDFQSAISNRRIFRLQF